MTTCGKVQEDDDLPEALWGYRDDAVAVNTSYNPTSKIQTIPLTFPSPNQNMHLHDSARQRKSKPETLDGCWDNVMNSEIVEVPLSRDRSQRALTWSSLLWLTKKGTPLWVCFLFPWVLTVLFDTFGSGALLVMMWWFYTSSFLYLWDVLKSLNVFCDNMNFHF